MGVDDDFSLEPEVSDVIKNIAGKFENDFKVTAEHLSKTQVIIALVGNVNVGKSSLVNAIFGQDYADVDPLPGWTKDVKFYPLAENLIIADTPGLEDIDETHSTETWNVVGPKADLILLIINASAGLQKSERDTYKKLAKAGKPLLVIVNKKDQIQPQSRLDAVIDFIAKNLNTNKVIATSALHGEGIDVLTKSMFQILDENKRIIFLRYVQDKEPAIKKLVTLCALAAGGVGVIPIPFADMPFLTGIQIYLCTQIAHIYGIKISKTDALKFIGSTVGVLGFLGRSLFRQVIKALGDITIIGAGVTALIGAGVAASMTYGIGIAAKEFYKSGMSLDVTEIQSIFKSAYDSFKFDEVKKQQDLTG